MADAHPRKDAYLWGAVSVAVVLAVGSAVALRTTGVSDSMVTPIAATLLLFCLAGAVALQRFGMSFEAGGERLTVSLEEALVFLMFLAFTTPVIPLVVLGSTLIGQLMSGRRLEKVAFNVAVYTLAAGAASVGFLWLTSRGMLPVFAAFPALAIYSLGSNLLVAGLFSVLEGSPIGESYRRRFLLPALIQIGVGTSAGVVLYALWLHHPLAVIAMAPFVLLLRGYLELAADASRKLAVHSRLASVSEALAGSRDIDGIAQRVLDTCADVLQPGSLELVLTQPERRWARAFEGGPALGRPPVRADLIGPEGTVIGHLVAHPSQRNNVAYGAAERELVRIVGGQAAVAFRNAIALQELAEAQGVAHEILESVPAGVVRVDARGRLVQLNPRMGAILGVSDPMCLHGRSILETSVCDGELGARVMALLAGHEFYDLEIRSKGATLAVSGVTLQGTDGRVTGAVLLFADITFRKESEAALRSQTLTRPFVRRLVLSIASRMNAPRTVIAEVGRGLAAELQLKEPEEFMAAFRSLGLGTLRLEQREGESYVFSADDLLERQPRASQPTCHLALGFLEGAVAAMHGGSLGSEVRCQSQGHASCRFVVQPRSFTEAKSVRLRSTSG